MKKIYKFIDCLGTIRLHKKDICGLEQFVSKVGKKYLARNNFYYKPKSTEEIDICRKILIRAVSLNKKRNYAIFDNLINLSSHVYFYCLLHSVSDAVKCQARDLMQEDVNNMVQLLDGKMEFVFKKEFPKIDAVVDFRNIELDNKLEVYSYVKSFGRTNNRFITPGLGSILLGPFFKAIWGNNYINICYSRFKGNKDTSSFDKILKKEEFYLIDDNVGSGFTTQEIVDLSGGKIKKISAVEYDWNLFDVITKGESSYSKFDYNFYDKLTFLNSRNHRFLDLMVETIKEEPGKYQTIKRDNEFNKKLDVVAIYRIGRKKAKKHLNKPLYCKTKAFSKKILNFYRGA